MSARSLIALLCLFLISCSSTEEPLEMEMEALFAYEGDWLGRWSDSLFSNIAVSAKIRSAGSNKYTGALYYNNMGKGPYVACCGGPNDGSITFETEGDEVTSFTYNQTAPEYRDGCPGTYTGSGAIDRDRNRLIINFTGTDCDGFHDNGMIVWELDQ